MGNNKPNAYSLFVFDRAARMRRSGDVVNQASLFKDLGPVWKAMSEEEKQYYKDKAKNKETHRKNTSFTNSDQSQPINKDQPEDCKANISQQPTTSWCQSDDDDPVPDIKIKPEPKDTKVAIKRPLDSEDNQVAVPTGKKGRPGLPKNLRKDNDAYEDDRRKYRDHHLFQLRCCCERVVKGRGRDIMDMPFYAISANVMCRTRDPIDQQLKYLPLELGIFAYSIREGRLGTPYNALIDAGPAPTHLNCDAEAHSLATHKIPFPPRKSYPPQARSNYKKIYKEIFEFTREGEGIVCVSDPILINQVKGSLDWLYEKAKEAGSKLLEPGSAFTVVPVVELVTCMYNYVYQEILGNPHPKFALHYRCLLEVDCSKFDYNTDMKCQFHKTENFESMYCTMTCAMKTILNLEDIIEEIFKMYEVHVDEQKRKANVPTTTTTNDVDDEVSKPPTVPLPLPLPMPPDQRPIEVPEFILRNTLGPLPPDVIELPLTHEQVAVRPKPKRPKSPQIITSGGTVPEYPPDVF